MICRKLKCKVCGKSSSQCLANVTDICDQILDNGSKSHM